MVGGISDEDLEIWKRYLNGDLAISPIPASKSVARSPENKKLDLHGMTIQAAFNATRDFITKHSTAGTKDIVVVCGKGGKIADELPLWCENLPMVRECIPQIDSRGEHGSYRIKLRKV